MGMKRKILVMALIMLLLLLTVAGCGAQKSELTRIRLNEVTHSIFYAPMYVAINEGFFAEAGLEIELTNGAGADKVMTALLSDQADIGLMGPEATVYVYNEGKSNYVVNFAQLTNGDGSFLVSRKPEPDFQWSSLKGKTIIGGRIGGMPEMTLEYVLKKHGLIPNEDVTVLTNVQFALMAGAFTGGTGDYVALFEPVASQMELENQGYVVASIGAEAGEVPYTVFSATKSYIEENEEIIQKFTTALCRAQKWVQEAPIEEVAKAIKPSFPDTSDELIISAAARYRDQGSWARTPIFTESAFERLQDIMMEADQLDKKAPYEKLVTNKYAEQAIAEIGGK